LIDRTASELQAHNAALRAKKIAEGWQPGRGAWWTRTRLRELRTMRDTQGVQAAATQHGIGVDRVRQLLKHLAWLERLARGPKAD